MAELKVFSPPARSDHLRQRRKEKNCHCEATLGSRGNLVRHEITTPREARLVMTEEACEIIEYY
jgi:hypothetical protein